MSGCAKVREWNPIWRPSETVLCSLLTLWRLGASGA